MKVENVSVGGCHKNVYCKVKLRITFICNFKSYVMLSNNVVAMSMGTSTQRKRYWICVDRSACAEFNTATDFRYHNVLLLRYLRSN